jgi:hypothetical protein
MVAASSAAQVSRATTIRDVYTEGGRSVVMVEERVLVLSPIAASILDAVPPNETVDMLQIVASVVETHGAPERPADAEGLVQRQVLDLEAHGLLVLIDDDSTAGGRTPSSPDAVAAGALAAVTGALESVLSCGGGASWALPDDVSDWAFLEAVRRQRVVSQLALHLDRSLLPDSLTAPLSALHAELAAANVDVGRDLHLVLDSLAASGVRAMVFKGQALAAQAWGDADARGYGDLDLLVSPSDLEQACARLTADNWSTGGLYPMPGRSWGWRHFTRTENEMSFGRRRTVVDLHWHAVPARNAFPTFDELWSRRAYVQVGEGDVPTFGLYDALLHSASHSAKDHWRWLRGLADVHRLISLPATWAAAHRPLRGDQLLSIGVSASLFGVPRNSPAIVHEAVEKSRSVMAQVERDQVAPEHIDPTTWVPGLGTARMMVPLWHTRAHPREFARKLSSGAMPPWTLAQQSSTHSYIAAPAAVLARISELRRRVSERGAGPI